ncbi:MAG TPA: acid-soluble spore protein [Pelotomaculum sp.]|uniref:Small, acid-soluble spore protein beta n=1 Tax=Pelotomaculum schinkii TaxID=78350 RepID=A0A4Y7R8U0_9FIRM|nr:alpha/beta-type small acid-soluble spore protein [Pelotomaculum sp. FP]TEB05071.1 Small, acid-soluble spore protein beta [Pelotomaculum schinkii]TEB14330.1 Small, acid-soluble spore protein beta [Pelotomaculum sp. FP]HBC93725.1 acid-soluble spore protein [Pelotomaculum sp.]
MTNKLVLIENKDLIAKDLQQYIEPALNQFKVELAAELGIPDYDKIDKGELSSRNNGKVGGNMTKRMVNFAQAVLAFNYRNQLEGTK